MSSSRREGITLPFTTLDVFTSTPFTGNPLGLVLLAPEHHALPQETKQRVAREFNLSETVFLHVPAPDDAPDPTELRLDIFTLDRELTFAGHPTIGTAAYLLQGHSPFRNVSRLLIKAGPIEISRVSGEENVRAAIPHDVHVHSRTLGSILQDRAEHGLSADATLRTAELKAPVVSVVKGMTFIPVRLPDLDALAKANPGGPRLDPSTLPAPGLQDAGEWDGGFIGRYYYVLGKVSVHDNDKRVSAQLRTRMVEPGFEDPATGSAASTLASYLAISGTLGSDVTKSFEFEVEQGVEMGRPSVIRVEVVREKKADGGWKVKELYLGGTAVVVMKGTISV